MTLRRGFGAVFACTVLLATVGVTHVQATPVTIIDSSTLGHYNQALGTVLDGSEIHFPCANVVCGDPTASFPAPGGEPVLTAGAGVLGNWLASPPVLGGSWSAAQLIPANWAVNTETAIVYPIDAGNGLTNVSASLGVDNGIFVWLDGVYLFGAQAPGGSFPGEYTVPLGDLSPGMHHLQILREDHGGATGFHISVVGTSNAGPDCSGVTADPSSLWPPNHTLREVSLSDASDAEDGAIGVTVTGVTQDEPVNGTGDGSTAPDAVLGGGSDVQLRAERSGGGDGRVYRVAFSATDSEGATCAGVVIVQVPHDDSGQAAVDSGAVFDSTSP